MRFDEQKCCERYDRKTAIRLVDVTTNDVRHLAWLRERLGGRLAEAAVITTGHHAYRRPDGIAVIPASLLGP
jgi:hypothetical protein